MNQTTRMSEHDIKVAIIDRFICDHPYIDRRDVSVHLEISGVDVKARIVWDDNVKKDEQTFDGLDMPYGC